MGQRREQCLRGWGIREESHSVRGNAIWELIGTHGYTGMMPTVLLNVSGCAYRTEKRQ